MSVLKSCVIAFSMYSKIPMPQFTWEEKDMKYVMAFFPLVGAVIGFVSWFWSLFCQEFGVGKILFAAVGVVIPLFLSGGIHIDGFMDTMDAFHSYQEKERKLEILKDSHIGAFSVICLTMYYLLYVGVYSELQGKEAFLVVAAGFYLSRILSGIGVVSFRCAKSNGLVYLFSSTAQEKIVKAALYIQLILCAGVLVGFAGITGIVALAAALLWLWIYWRKCRQELGGITGDTAGYFLSVCELLTAVIAAGSSMFSQILLH